MFLNYFISCQRNMNNTSWLLVLKLSRGILGWMISSLLHLILETRFYYADKQLCDHQSSLEMDTPKIPNGKWKHHLEIGMGTCDSFRSRFSSNGWRTLSCINFILVNLSLLPPCLYHNWKASSWTGFCICLHLQKTLFEKVRCVCALATLLLPICSLIHSKSCLEARCAKGSPYLSQWLFLSEYNKFCFHLILFLHYGGVGFLFPQAF